MKQSTALIVYQPTLVLTGKTSPEDVRRQEIRVETAKLRRILDGTYKRDERIAAYGRKENDMSKHRLTILNLTDPQEGPSTVPVVDDPALGNVPLLEVGKRYAVSLRLVPLGQKVFVDIWKLDENSLEREKIIKILVDAPQEDKGHKKFGAGYIGEMGDDEVFAIKQNDDTGDPNHGRAIEFVYGNRDKNGVRHERESVICRVKKEF